MYVMTANISSRLSGHISPYHTAREGGRMRCYCDMDVFGLFCCNLDVRRLLWSRGREEVSHNINKGAEGIKCSLGCVFSILFTGEVAGRLDSYILGY